MGAITDSTRAVLPESAEPRARLAQDLGPISRELTIPGITLTFQRSPEQETELKALLAAQLDKHSPQYHRWLTPETFATRFGIADEDIAATRVWLQSQGFRIDNVSRNRDRITFSGTAAQVQTAFGSELHRYRSEDGEHFAPSSDLTLPAELASITSAVLHLSDYRPMPGVKAISQAAPEYTSSATQAHYLVPNDVLTMYDVNPILRRGINQVGSAIAIVGQSYVNTGVDSSLFTFSTSGLGTEGGVTAVLVPGSGVEAVSPGDESESEIDLEYASGITGAGVFFVHVGDSQNYSVFDALDFAITQDIASVVSISYGACEALLSASEMDQYNAIFEQASAQGQTLIASSGDSGSTACAHFTTAEGVTTIEQESLAVNFPADSPYVTAVGGTQMAPGTFTAGSSPYWNSAMDSGPDNTNSLLSYVPEVAWNEGNASLGIIAGGGGTSSHFLRPTWQNAYPGMSSGSYRLLPDIALQSSIFSPGFIFCTSDPSMLYSEGQTSSCSVGLKGSNGKYTLAGGTSFAAPIFAGMIALLNGYENTTGQGNINPVLYGLAADSSTYTAAFHDITTGSNACPTGATDCTASSDSNYIATPGYDEATGLGSIDFNALAQAWPTTTSAGLQATQLSIGAPVSSAQPGQTIPININLDPISFSLAIPLTSPTGNVSVSVDGVVVEASLPISQVLPVYAAASYSFVAPSAVGSHLLVVSYPGDAAHYATTSTYSVMVGNVVPSGSLTLGAANLAVASNSHASTTVTATPSNGYNGRLFWSLSAAGSTSETLCYGIASLLVNNVSTTSLTIGAGTACSSASASSQKIQVKKIAPNSKTFSKLHATAASATYACLILCGFLARRRRKWNLSLLVSALTLSLAGTTIVGCGGGSSTSTTPPKTTAATFTMTLTGTDSVNASITTSTTFTLTVN